MRVNEELTARLNNIYMEREEDYGSSINLQELDEKLNNALENGTNESMRDWLDSLRNK